MASITFFDFSINRRHHDIITRTSQFIPHHLSYAFRIRLDCQRRRNARRIRRLGAYRTSRKAGIDCPKSIRLIPFSVNASHGIEHALHHHFLHTPILGDTTMTPFTTNQPTTGTTMHTTNQPTNAHIEHSQSSAIPSTWNDSNHWIDTNPAKDLPNPSEYRSEVGVMFDFLSRVADTWVHTGRAKVLLDMARNELVSYGRSPFYHVLIEELVSLYNAPQGGE